MELWKYKGDHGRIVIQSMYFVFTTLSTVGFGDLYPHSDVERCFTACVILGGIIVFSRVVGLFGSILEDEEELNATVDEGDQLDRMFSLLQQRSGDEPVDRKLRDRITNHFDYFWNNDHNYALTTDFG